MLWRCGRTTRLGLRNATKYRIAGIFRGVHIFANFANEQQLVNI